MHLRNGHFPLRFMHSLREHEQMSSRVSMSPPWQQRKWKQKCNKTYEDFSSAEYFCSAVQLHNRYV
jgi:hypothetical protein